MDGIRVFQDISYPSAIKKTPEVIARIEELMKYETAGDLITGLKWTRKTTEKIAEELESIGIMVSANTAGKLLKKLGKL